MKTFSTSGTGNQQTLSEIESNKVPIYDSLADVEADLANLSVGQIVATKDTGDELAQPVDVVEEGNLHAVSSNAVAEALENGTEANKVFTQNGTTTFYHIQKWGKLRIATVEMHNPTGSNLGTFNSVVLVNDTGFRPVADADGLIVNAHSSTDFHGKVNLSTTGRLTLTESWGMTSGNSTAYAVLVWIEA